MSRQAFIDLGTNTFHLLIAEFANGQSEILIRKKEIVGLGAGGINKRIITPEAMDRGLATLRRFRVDCDQYNTTNIKAFGTSALRVSENSTDFIDKVSKDTGITIKIIDGNREAELITLGIQFMTPVEQQPCLLMDIGGGSTEFIVVNGSEILWKRSFEVGVQRLVMSYLNKDPLTEVNRVALDTYLDEIFYPLKEIKALHFKSMIGASGTFTTLLRMLQVETSHNDIEKVPATFAEKVYRLVTSLPRAERLQLPGLDPARSDLIVVGMCLVHHVINKFSIKEFYVSEGGLKEGALMLAMKEKI